MSFLDRFKPQPRWKHADPAIRAAAVTEVPLDDEHRADLMELAGDEDPRVRRAAAARLFAVEDLVRMAAMERDPELRREIGDRLVAFAVAPADTDAGAALALEGLDEPKQCATVAKSSPHENVRAAALGRVHDVKALGSIARNAGDSQTALDAVRRIADPAELLNVASRTDHKEAGLAALEMCAATPPGELRDMLEGLSGRAKNRSVAKRARAMVQAMDEAEAARQVALEQWQQRVASVAARVEAIAAAPSIPNASRQVDQAEAEWSELAGSGTFELDPDTAGRFGALVETARTGIAAHERAQAELRAAADRIAADRAVRLSICERIENARADAVLGTLETARAEWEGLPPSEAADAADQALRGRFVSACARADERLQNRQDLERIQSRLGELSIEAERLVSLETLPEGDWVALTREWQSLAGTADAIDPVAAERYSAAEAQVAQRVAERRAASERARRQHVQRIEQLLERATRRAPAEDLTLREADRIARELRTAVESPDEDRDLADRLKAAQSAIAPRIHELREMDEWKRFANAAVQEELIAKTEALRAKYNFDAPEGPKPEDLDKAARELHEIQERWKQAAEAPRAQAQALWHRYRQAADPIQARVREFFAVRGEERKGNLERKLALIERAEALADSTDWIRTAEELKRLQAEWQAIGPVPRQETRVTWKRFREACDRFFTRRNADLAERKETWSANLARKEALSARAEELARSTEWEKGAAEIRRLQAEWKTVGPVRRNKSEVIWQRFRTACDTFFDRYKRRDEIELEAKQADREALVLELEALNPAGRGEAADLAAPDAAGDFAPAEPGALDRVMLLEQVRSLRSRWNQTAPAVRHGADPLSARFMQALERLLAAYPEAFHGTELDAGANRQKMEKLVEKVEGFLTNAGAAPASSSQALAAMLREALASNTIGGRAGEESKWRALAEDVRQAQAAWSRLGPVPDEAGRQLADRFHRACGRFFDQLRRHVPPAPAPQRGRPVGAGR